MRRSLMGLAMLLIASFSGVAAAAQCGTFVDVDSAAFYCSNTQWIKNRGVTVGCTDAQHYCPNDFVPRSQMAAFMNRLGTALTPNVQRVAQSSVALSIGVGGNSAAVCQTTDYPAANYPRTVYMTGTMNTSLTVGLAAYDLNLDPVISLDAGATWQAINDTSSTVHLPALATLGVDAPLNGMASIDAGESFRMGLQASSTALVSLSLSAGCSMLTVVQSRDGTSAPF